MGKTRVRLFGHKNPSIRGLKSVKFFSLFLSSSMRGGWRSVESAGFLPRSGVRPGACIRRREVSIVRKRLHTARVRQQGFTLIELVMVIVILGVLAAFALPKYITLDSDAQQAAVNGVAGALNSAAAVNYASRKANASNGVAVATCGAAGSTLQGGLPSGFTITTAATAVAADASVACTVQGPGPKTATFTAIGI
jgi:MSHA pilin protein MshA